MNEGFIDNGRGVWMWIERGILAFVSALVFSTYLDVRGLVIDRAVTEQWRLQLDVRTAAIESQLKAHRELPCHDRSCYELDEIKALRRKLNDKAGQ